MFCQEWRFPLTRGTQSFLADKEKLSKTLKNRQGEISEEREQPQLELKQEQLREEEQPNFVKDKKSMSVECAGRNSRPKIENCNTDAV